MITAVDSNVLFDLFVGQGEALNDAVACLEMAQHAGQVVISAVVYAELSPRFLLKTQLDEVLSNLEFLVVPLDAEAAFEAGCAFSLYLKRGGTRQRILTDFFIGAHAGTSADCLITRDARFFQAQFTGINAITPAEFIAHART